ncbi:MAG: membrane dipeptidase, partial [Myxococcota bacterium]|nr:membrane dipeptidase [Myxococcota bacterium]
SMTTNPLRSGSGQWRTLLGNLELVRQVVDGTGGAMSLVTDYPGYVAARRAGAHGCMLAIQGASPLLHAPDGLDGLPEDLVVRVALVHLFSGAAGSSASSLGFVGRRATLPEGAEGLIEALNARRIQVDLSHLSPAHFKRALEVHDASLPVVVSHAGARALTPRGTNLTDEQLRAVAETDGVVGVTLNQSAVRRPGQTDGVQAVVAHLTHMVDVVGDRHVGVGSDLDGGGHPTSELASWDLWPRLVHGLLEQGWRGERIRRVLGGNALRVLHAHRPGAETSEMAEATLGQAIVADQIPWAEEEAPALEAISPPEKEANTRRLTDRVDRGNRSQPRAGVQAPETSPEPVATPPASQETPPAAEASEEAPRKPAVSDRRGFFRLGGEQLKDTALQTARGLVSAAGEFKDELHQEREEDDFHRDRVRTTGEPAGRAFVRPPGALDEAAFLETCEKCQACARACPEASIVPAGPQHGRRVEMSPILILDQQPCFVCEDVPCASACPSGALQPIPASAIRIAVAEAIGERCLNARGET